MGARVGRHALALLISSPKKLHKCIPLDHITLIYDVYSCLKWQEFLKVFKIFRAVFCSVKMIGDYFAAADWRGNWPCCIKYTASSDRSAGVTPSSRSACPKVAGRCFVIFSTASRPMPLICL